LLRAMLSSDVLAVLIVDVFSVRIVNPCNKDNGQKQERIL